MKGVLSMTAIQEAFEKAGLKPRDVEFDRAIAVYLNSGGTIEGVRERVEVAAKRMPVMDHGAVARQSQFLNVQTRQQAEDVRGHPSVVSDDLSVNASPSSPVEDGGGQTRIASDGHAELAPPSSSPSAGADHFDHAQKSHSALVSFSDSPIAGGESHHAAAPKRQLKHALPASEPSAAYLKAAGEYRLQAARNALYRHKTSNGAWWGDVHPYEVVGMTRDNIRGMALMSACGPLNPKQMQMTFAQLLKPDQAEIAMNKAEKDLVNVA
jgi:hypothetical protein